jgi:ribonuclease HI
MSFFAVARGRKVGVYRTWRECQEQVDKFSRAAFKKFNTLEDANAFIAAYAEVTTSAPVVVQVATPPKPISDPIDPDAIASSSSSAGIVRKDPEQPGEAGNDDANDSIRSPLKRARVGDASSSESAATPQPVIVYCDGSALGNGSRSAVAASACWFMSHKHNPPLVQHRTPGRQTNSRAELFAVALALNASLADQTVQVFVDSDYVIRGIADLRTYKREGWGTAKPLPNADLWQLIYALLKERIRLRVDRVVFKHVAAHTGNEGNERADRLANAATAMSPATRQSIETIFDIDFDWSQLQVDIREQHEAGDAQQ